MNNIIQMLQASGNPQQYAYNQLKQMANSNPMIANALNDPNLAETIARNLAKEKGINIDEVISFYKKFFS